MLHFVLFFVSVVWHYPHQEVKGASYCWRLNSGSLRLLGHGGCGAELVQGSISLLSYMTQFGEAKTSAETFAT